MSTDRKQRILDLFEEEYKEMQQSLELVSPEYRALVALEKQMHEHRESMGLNGFVAEPVTPEDQEEVERVVEQVLQLDIIPDSEIEHAKTIPTSGKRYRGKQLRFILEKYRKAMSKTDLERKLNKELGLDPKTEINTREALKRGVDLNDITYVKFGGSQRYAFLVLPEWIRKNREGERYVPKKYLPSRTKLPVNFDHDDQQII